MHAKWQMTSCGKDTDQQYHACAVSLDGKQLVMREGETSQEHDLVSKLGKLRLTWELYRPDFGNTIAIQTGRTSLPVYALNGGLNALLLRCLFTRVSLFSACGLHTTACCCALAHTSPLRRFASCPGR